MKQVVLLLSLLSCTANLFAVDGEVLESKGDFNQKFLEANQLMEEKAWRESISIWQELYSINNTNANVNYKLGYCYLQTSNDKLKSLTFLKTAASMELAKNYDPYDPSEDGAPVEAIFYLGRALHLNYQIDDAINSYNLLLEKITTKHFLHKEALRQIAMCNEAKYQLANAQNYLITNVGNVVNNDANDYSPIVSVDETALFFTSRRVRGDSSNNFIRDLDTGEWKEDIYVSYKDQDDEWTEPELLNINTDEHAASISVSPDGQKLYLYYDEGGNGQIYESVLVGETWEEPQLMGSDINSDAWETHATVSADGKTLYFVSNRDGGYGGRDIYRCVKLPNDDWSKALNIGPNINTEYEEDAVFLSVDGKTLYFASTGHKTMGGFDIFYSTIGTDGEWSEPVNIGYPLNTVDDDVFFYPTADQKSAYYSSRKEEGFGLKDIYRIDMPDTPLESDLAVLKGYIIAPEGEDLPENCYVLVTNNKNGDVTEYHPRARDGAYVAILPPCMGYHIEYVVQREIVHEEFINVPCESAYNEIEKEIYLLPLHLGGPPEVVVIDKSNDDPKVDDPKVDDPIVEVPDTGFDPENPVNVTVTATEAYFERFFVYDFHEFGTGEEKFAEFIEGVKGLIDINGTAELHVESSASWVPSSRFRDNYELTGWRNQTARDQMSDALSILGYTKGEDYTFDSPEEKVQGPKYENDAHKKNKYEPFQYIKAWAK